MAYKNKKKQKAHVESLSGTGWRADNKRVIRYRKLMASLPSNLSTREKEDLLRKWGKI